MCTSLYLKQNKNHETTQTKVNFKGTNVYPKGTNVHPYVLKSYHSSDRFFISECAVIQKYVLIWGFSTTINLPALWIEQTVCKVHFLQLFVEQTRKKGEMNLESGGKKKVSRKL